MSAIKLTRAQASRALIIGLGVGSLNTNLQRHGIRVDSVEIEPAVIAAARKHFDWKPNGFVSNEDAFDFLLRHDSAKTNVLYDYVIVDVYTARGKKNSRLYTAESIIRMKSMLKQDGILVINLVTFVTDGLNRRYTKISSAIFNTLSHLFKNVRCFIDNDPSQTASDEAINLICFASESAIYFELPPSRSDESNTQDYILQQFQSWEIKFELNSSETFTSGTEDLIDAESDNVHQSIEQQIVDIFT